MSNRLDQAFDQLIDRICIAVPAYGRYVYRRIAKTHTGWHLLVFFASAGRKAGAFLHHFSSDEEMNQYLSGLSRRVLSGFGFGSRYGAKKSESRLFSMEGLRFRLILALLFLAVLGAVFSPGRRMAACVLSFAFFFLGCAVSLPYRPIAGNLRQTWVEGKILSSAGFTALLLLWFREYLQNGIASNVFLQGTMMIAMLLHFSVYLATIAFNHQQHIFLRLLDGLTGILPALAAAAASCLLPAAFGGGGAAAALGCAMGAWMLFVSDRLESVSALGGMPLPYISLITALLTAAGCFLLLLSAWHTI